MGDGYHHKLLVAIGMSDWTRPAWVLSIVGLTVAVRVLIMPLFVKQIRCFTRYASHAA